MSKGRIRVESTRRGYMKRFLIQEKGGEKVNCKRKEEIRKKKKKSYATLWDKGTKTGNQQ